MLVDGPRRWLRFQAKMGHNHGRGYDYNRVRKPHRSRVAERWIYRTKIFLMLAVGGSIAGYIVYLAVTK